MKNDPWRAARCRALSCGENDWMNQHEGETMGGMFSSAPAAAQVPILAANRKRTLWPSSVRSLSICRLLVLFLGMAAPMMVSAATSFVPTRDKDYVVLDKVEPFSNEPGIDVVEVFSYACHACAAFQPQMAKWLLTKPKDVHFEYVPAVFGGDFDAAAKAYYAAYRLKKVEQTHEGIYRAIHTDQTLTSAKLDDIAAAYARLGVNAGQFRREYEGEEVATLVKEAKAYAVGAGVSSTPTLIVAGKYRVAMGRDQRGDKVLATVDYLIDMERNERSAHR